MTINRQINTIQQEQQLENKNVCMTFKHNTTDK